jgi:hypothetical protein
MIARFGEFVTAHLSDTLGCSLIPVTQRRSPSVRKETAALLRPAQPDKPREVRGEPPVRQQKRGADIMATTDDTAAGADDPFTAVKWSDEHGWTSLIERYQPLVNSVCRRYRLKPEDAADVSQTVWMRVIENLDRIREPRALPAWIKTTASRAALAVLRAENRLTLLDFPRTTLPVGLR